MSSTKGINAIGRPASDYYQTPLWVCHVWAREARALGFGGNTRVVDLGAGDGRIGTIVSEGIGSLWPWVGLDTHPRGPASNYPERIYKTDLLSADTLHLAHFASEIPLSPWYPVLFVANPPFRYMLEFADLATRALAFCPPGSGVSMLGRQGFKGSLKRARWHLDNPLAAETTLCPRPKFIKNATDSCEYSLFWWTKSGLPEGVRRFRVGLDPEKQTEV